MNSIYMLPIYMMLGAIIGLLILIFNSIPIVEPKQGEWIDYNPNEPLDPRETCSVCGNTEALHKGNYCPNCGARMKGINDE